MLATFYAAALAYDQVYSEDLGQYETNHDELSNEENLMQRQPSTETGSAAVDSMEPAVSTCTSNIETIFSPILESVDFYNNEGNDILYVPQLDSEDSDDSSRSSCEYQACSVSDFYISDMIFSGPPVGSNYPGEPIGSHSEFDDRTDALLLPDYKCEESSLLCDLTEECMVLPFLEDTLATGCDHDGGPSEETILDADNSSLYMAIHQLRSHNQDSHINTYSDQDYECFDPQMYIRNLPEQPDVAFTSPPTSVPNGKQNAKQITLVLDLDETLVHSTLDYCDDADFTFSVFFNMKEHTSKHLCKQLLDVLDPDGTVISRRAYRESCIFSEGTYMKDLTVLGVDLAKVAIIDNSPQVFRLQVNNGIPIKSWFDDPSDSALISLLPFLEMLVDADDVRPIIARKFGIKFYKFLPLLSQFAIIPFSSLLFENLEIYMNTALKGLLEEIRSLEDIFMTVLADNRSYLYYACCSAIKLPALAKAGPFPVFLLSFRRQQFGSLAYNPLRVFVMNKKGHGFGAVCYSSPLTPRNLQWISAVSTAYVVASLPWILIGSKFEFSLFKSPNVSEGKGYPQIFLVPLFALQAPASIVSWIKGEYGVWTAFLALLVRLFFFIPGELELPFIAFLLVIVSPNQIMRLRGTQEGVIISLAIAAYLAFQHFSRAGSLGKAFDQGSILATLATISIVVAPCLLLI
ncbi:cold-regulated inner membrane protein 1, chloroplastic [Sesamum angolense]|uniref:Cold-regulated inner membrane protein 1, chloroplastic n=1 Tax=Sesamum angolense TaxID=2727404 RepID=A0AAE1WTC7_9LAMI|nr:cold-regulated inner membrane protein 1, chloroplastic [Sesamum angolense]